MTGPDPDLRSRVRATMALLTTNLSLIFLHDNETDPSDLRPVVGEIAETLIRDLR
jgi:hypothetical protein